MATKKDYNFGENKTEYNAKTGKTCDVWQTPKYLEAKRKAIEALESKEYKDVLTEGDFWILMNGTKSGKMAYTGLIISHNGCLKINDRLPENLRFKPSCMSLDKDGFNNSLVYSYCNDEQGVYEVGEVSAKNCTNAYPYAMALKRCMDRVILKNSKLAYSGIYSDSEAEEFKNDDDKKPKTETKAPSNISVTGDEVKKDLARLCKDNGLDIYAVAKLYKLNSEAGVDQFVYAYSEVENRIMNGDLNGLVKEG